MVIWWIPCMDTRMLPVSFSRYSPYATAKFELKFIQERNWSIHKHNTPNCTVPCNIDCKYFLHCYMIGTVTMKLGLWYLQFSIRNLLLYKEKTPQDISWVLKRNNSIYLSTPVPLAYQWFPTFLEQIAQTISPLWTITRICIEKRALENHSFPCACRSAFDASYIKSHSIHYITNKLTTNEPLLRNPLPWVNLPAGWAPVP